MKLIYYFILGIVIVSPIPVFAEIQKLTIDKSNYFQGDSITFTGTVTPEENFPFVLVRVYNPSQSDFVFLNQIPIGSNGKFQGTFIADGKKWSEEGPYTLLVTYAGTTKEKSFQFNFQTSVEQPKEKKSETITLENTTDTPSNIEKILPEQPIPLSRENLKERIPGFPSLDKSPQYYFERYNNEENYRKWFNSQFPNHSIQQVVGYSETHIPNFPDDSKPPNYYINRFQTELNYREWFNSQFPNQSIFSVLGFAEKPRVPDWIKLNAEWWADEKIDDVDFLSGLKYLIDNKIILLEDIPRQNYSETEIPTWVRNVANWWSDDMISEEEFIQSLRFLIEQGIIVVK